MLQVPNILEIEEYQLTSWSTLIEFDILSHGNMVTCAFEWGSRRESIIITKSSFASVRPAIVATC